MTGPTSGRKADVSVGVDATAISRVRRLLDRTAGFRAYAFAPAEREYCDARANPAEHYAARWAAKEAYLKAVSGVGVNEADVDGAPDLASMRVVRDPEPRLALSGDGRALLAAAAEQRRSTVADADLAVSLTHERALDAAFAVVVVRFR